MSKAIIAALLATSAVAWGLEPVFSCRNQDRCCLDSGQAAVPASPRPLESADVLPSHGGARADGFVA